MFEFLEDLEWSTVGWALAMWGFCVLVLWKLIYDPNVISFPIKVVLTVALLPICYVIFHVMTNRD